MWGGIEYKFMLFKTRSSFSHRRVIHSFGGVGFSFVVNCPLGYIKVETIFYSGMEGLRQ